MPTQIRVGGIWNQLTGCKVFANKAWCTIKAIQVYSGGAWRLVGNFTTVAPPPGGGGTGGGGGGGTLALTISPSPFQGQNSPTRDQPTAHLTATPSGGLSPYTYSWTKLSGPSTVVIVSPTHASTAVTGDDGDAATLRCTATDSLGTTAHADVSGTFVFNDFGTQ